MQSAEVCVFREKLEFAAAWNHALKHEHKAANYEEILRLKLPQLAVSPQGSSSGKAKTVKSLVPNRFELFLWKNLLGNSPLGAFNLI